MALLITLSTIVPLGNLLQVAPTLAGTSSLTVAISGVTREITVTLAGS